MKIRQKAEGRRQKAEGFSFLLLRRTLREHGDMKAHGAYLEEEQLNVTPLIAKNLFYSGMRIVVTG
ncbi:MAG: hypothetical protein AB1589_11335 [Cyanobacteriota bacterium]